MSSKCVAVEHKPARKTMTYTFVGKSNLPLIKTKPAFELAFKRAFARWSAVVPVDFVRWKEPAIYPVKSSATSSKADIRIRFYTKNHCGSLQGKGMLAHAHVGDGRICLKGNLNWAVDKEGLWDNIGIDLDSVAIHEIGHIVGLQEHSEDPISVMFKNIPRGAKRVIMKEDVARIQHLYMPKPIVLQN